jgi:hypothetical protein
MGLQEGRLRGWWAVPGHLPGAGQPPGRGDDHGPVDHGGVMLAEPFVVADGAPGAGDPGEGPLSHPAAAQPHEGVRGGAFDHFHGQLQACRRPGQQPARVPRRRPRPRSRCGR